MKCLWTPVCLILTGASSLFAGSMFEFRNPTPVKFEIENVAFRGAAPQWLQATLSGDTNTVELGSRIVLQLHSGDQLAKIIKSSSLTVAREVSNNLFILQAPDALTAATEAQRLSSLEGVAACHPIIRWPGELDAAYAPRPNDNYIQLQWNLENRAADGSRAGVDLNVRAAWPFSRGLGSTVAIADCGIEHTHVELQSRMAPAGLHYNFSNDSTNTLPASGTGNFAHATECAGLVAAESNNSIGMSGVAPQAQLANLVIFHTNLLLVSEEKLMDMYQFKSNSISVQNHSWTRVGSTIFLPQGLLESNGIENAVSQGRNGRGVVMIRSAGNDTDHAAMSSAGDNATTSDPRAIAVGAVRLNGRATSYSKPGASVLVAAPGGDNDFSIFTTDLMGTRGANVFNYNPPFQDLNNYTYPAGFTGTSASAPQVAGIAALMLAANTNLSYRDVQHILALSSRHFDLADPDLRTNGAGLLVSHYQGFGVPDAGVAVRLARDWPSRPSRMSTKVSVTNVVAIPDAGLRAFFTGTNLSIASAIGAPGWGPHPDSPTLSLPLVDVGVAAAPIAINLTNKAALIKRDATSFERKITNAANAGASFAIIYNNSATNPIFSMGNTDFVPIPAVFIPQAAGEVLQSYLQTNSASAQLGLNSAEVSFPVSQTLLCEHVGLKLTANHPVRGDLRVTLTSPSGTRSILQKLNQDTNAGPNGWTYWSTHHFLEGSAGTWTLAVTDEFETGSGSVTAAELIIYGTAIVDSDNDGLDDNWETTRFSSLSQVAKGDPDKDGYNNAREQVMGTNPNQAEPLQLDLSPWNPSLARISWPSSTNFNYAVYSGTNVAALTLVTNIAGRFPETEWFASYTNAHRFVRIEQTPIP